MPTLNAHLHLAHGRRDGKGGASAVRGSQFHVSTTSARHRHLHAPPAGIPGLGLAATAHGAATYSFPADDAYMQHSSSGSNSSDAAAAAAGTQPPTSRPSTAATASSPPHHLAISHHHAPAPGPAGPHVFPAYTTSHAAPLLPTAAAHGGSTAGSRGSPAAAAIFRSVAMSQPMARVADPLSPRWQYPQQQQGPRVPPGDGDHGRLLLRSHEAVGGSWAGVSGLTGSGSSAAGRGGTAPSGDAAGLHTYVHPASAVRRSGNGWQGAAAPPQRGPSPYLAATWSPSRGPHMREIGGGGSSGGAGAAVGDVYGGGGTGGGGGGAAGGNPTRDAYRAAASSVLSSAGGRRTPPAGQPSRRAFSAAATSATATAVAAAVIAASAGPTLAGPPWPPPSGLAFSAGAAAGAEVAAGQAGGPATQHGSGSGGRSSVQRYDAAAAAVSAAGAAIPPQQLPAIQALSVAPASDATSQGLGQGQTRWDAAAKASHAVAGAAPPASGGGARPAAPAGRVIIFGAPAPAGVGLDALPRPRTQRYQVPVAARRLKPRGLGAAARLDGGSPGVTLLVGGGDRP